jgi:hypothetical protein
MTGEEDLEVDSDLKNLPEFVNLLSVRVNDSKMLGGAAARIDSRDMES